MLANHTSIASVRPSTCFLSFIDLTVSQLFKRMLDQFDKLKRRNAFLEQYKKERMFSDGLEEFDDARSVLPSTESLSTDRNLGRLVMNC